MTDTHTHAHTHTHTYTHESTESRGGRVAKCARKAEKLDIFIWRTRVCRGVVVVVRATTIKNSPTESGKPIRCCLHRVYIFVVGGFWLLNVSGRANGNRFSFRFFFFFLAPAAWLLLLLLSKRLPFPFSYFSPTKLKQKASVAAAATTYIVKHSPVVRFSFKRAHSHTIQKVFAYVGGM